MSLTSYRAAPPRVSRSDCCPEQSSPLAIDASVAVNLLPFAPRCAAGGHLLGTVRSKGRDGTGEHHQRAQGFGLRRRVLIRSVSASMDAITASLHSKTAVVRQNFAIWPRQNLNGLLQKKTGILLGRRGSDFLEDSAEPARKALKLWWVQ
jgi:hypothetical protein